MAIGRRARSLMGPILTANFVGYLILLGLAGWSLDKYIDGEQNHPHLGGNQSTSFMLVFASLAGAIGVCSVVAGWVHRRAWRSDSLAAAASSAIAGWALTALAFGLVCKEIIMGGAQRKKIANTGSIHRNINLEPAAVFAAVARRHVRQPVRTVVLKLWRRCYDKQEQDW